MTTLKFMTVDQHLVLQRQPVVASGDKNSVLIQIQLCSMWDGFDVKVAFFKDGNRDFVLDIPLEKGECMVPPEMLDSPCVLNIGVWGKDAKGRYKTSTMVKYRVQEGTPIEAGLTLIDVSDGTAQEDQVLEGATFYAGDTEMKTGNVKTYEEGDPAYMTPYIETDPTVPAWAKKPNPPTAAEVGAAPAPVRWIESLNTPGWYRIAKIVTTINSAAIHTFAMRLYIGGIYMNNLPRSNIVDISRGYSGNAIQKVFDVGDSAQITKVRMIQDSDGSEYVEVYYSPTKENPVHLTGHAISDTFEKISPIQRVTAEPKSIYAECDLNEWINPPMQLGVEYRTTERWQGKPVYVKAVDLGLLASSTTKYIDIGVPAANAIEAKFFVAGNPMKTLPIISYENGAVQAIAWLQSAQAIVRTFITFTNYNLMLVVKYTKD